jgi:hypothetical protein
MRIRQVRSAAPTNALYTPKPSNPAGCAIRRQALDRVGRTVRFGFFSRREKIEISV